MKLQFSGPNDSFLPVSDYITSVSITRTRMDSPSQIHILANRNILFHMCPPRAPLPLSLANVTAEHRKIPTDMLASLDVFPKAAETELTVRTNAGGFLSLASFAFLIIAIGSEIRQYADVRTATKMVLNEHPLPPLLPIAAEVEVANNCSFLHFDLTNVKRTFELEALVHKSFTQKGDKCVVRVNVSAPNVPASFHIGLGESFMKNGEHDHMWITLENRNLSHTVNWIRFGDVEMVSPLDGTSLVFAKANPYMITYSLQLVPVTVGFGTGYRAIASVAKTNLEKMRTKGMPGIIFRWNFAPIGIDTATVSEPVIGVVCHVLAVVGCFFVFVRFIDSIVFMMQVYK